MKIVQFAKDHPYLTGGGVLVGGLVLILILSSGGSGGGEEIASPNLGASQPDYSAAIAANAQLSQYQLSAQVAARESDNALAKAQSENDTLFKIASKNADVQNNANVLTAGVAQASIAGEVTKAQYAKETTLGVASFDYMAKRDAASYAASTAMAGFDRDKYIADKATQVAQIGANSERDVASILANRDATVTSINANRDISLSSIYANRDVTINTQNQATATHALNLNYNRDMQSLSNSATEKAAQIALDRDKANMDYLLGAYRQTSDNMLRFAGK